MNEKYNVEYDTAWNMSKSPPSGVVQGAGAPSASGALDELRCSGKRVPDGAIVAIPTARRGMCVHVWERESVGKM
jgi:hypothetical protein